MKLFISLLLYFASFSPHAAFTPRDEGAQRSTTGRSVKVGTSAASTSSSSSSSKTEHGEAAAAAAAEKKQSKAKEEVAATIEASSVGLEAGAASSSSSRRGKDQEAAELGGVRSPIPTSKQQAETSKTTTKAFRKSTAAIKAGGSGRASSSSTALVVSTTTASPTVFARGEVQHFDTITSIQYGPAYDSRSSSSSSTYTQIPHGAHSSGISSEWSLILSDVWLQEGPCVPYWETECPALDVKSLFHQTEVFLDHDVSCEYLFFGDWYVTAFPMQRKCADPRIDLCLFSTAHRAVTLFGSGGLTSSFQNLERHDHASSIMLPTLGGGPTSSSPSWQTLVQGPPRRRILTIEEYRQQVCALDRYRPALTPVSYYKYPWLKQWLTVRARYCEAMLDEGLLGQRETCGREPPALLELAAPASYREVWPPQVRGMQFYLGQSFWRDGSEWEKGRSEAFPHPFLQRCGYAVPDSIEPEFAPSDDPSSVSSTTTADSGRTSAGEAASSAEPKEKIPVRFRLRMAKGQTYRGRIYGQKHLQCSRVEPFFACNAYRASEWSVIWKHFGPGVCSTLYSIPEESFHQRVDATSADRSSTAQELQEQPLLRSSSFSINDARRRQVAMRGAFLRTRDAMLKRLNETRSSGGEGGVIMANLTSGEIINGTSGSSGAGALGDGENATSGENEADTAKDSKRSLMGGILDAILGSSTSSEQESTDNTTAGATSGVEKDSVAGTALEGATEQKSSGADASPTADDSGGKDISEDSASLSPSTTSTDETTSATSETPSTTEGDATNDEQQDNEHEGNEQEDDDEEDEEQEDEDQENNYPFGTSNVNVITLEEYDLMTRSNSWQTTRFISTHGHSRASTSSTSRYADEDSTPTSSTVADQDLDTLADTHEAFLATLNDTELDAYLDAHAPRQQPVDPAAQDAWFSDALDAFAPYESVSEKGVMKPRSKEPEPRFITEGINMTEMRTMETDYASQSAGAKILASSDGTQGAGHILKSDPSAYMLSPCSVRGAWFVLGLPEYISLEKVGFVSLEFFASQFRHIQILGSSSYPAERWRVLAEVELSLSETQQVFDVNKRCSRQENGCWVRFLKVRALSHYDLDGSVYCALTKIQVFGSTVLKELDKQLEKEDVELASQNLPVPSVGDLLGDYHERDNFFSTEPDLFLRRVGIDVPAYLRYDRGGSATTTTTATQQPGVGAVGSDQQQRKESGKNAAGDASGVGGMSTAGRNVVAGTTSAGAAGATVSSSSSSTTAAPSSWFSSGTAATSTGAPTPADSATAAGSATGTSASPSSSTSGAAGDGSSASDGSSAGTTGAAGATGGATTAVGVASGAMISGSGTAGNGIAGSGQNLGGALTDERRNGTTSGSASSNTVDSAMSASSDAEDDPSPFLEDGEIFTGPTAAEISEQILRFEDLGLDRMKTQLSDLGRSSDAMAVLKQIVNTVSPPASGDANGDKTAALMKQMMSVVGGGDAAAKLMMIDPNSAYYANLPPAEQNLRAATPPSPGGEKPALMRILENIRLLESKHIDLSKLSRNMLGSMRNQELVLTLLSSILLTLHDQTREYRGKLDKVQKVFLKGRDHCFESILNNQAGAFGVTGISSSGLRAGGNATNNSSSVGGAGVGVGSSGVAGGSSSSSGTSNGATGVGEVDPFLCLLEAALNSTAAGLPDGAEDDNNILQRLRDRLVPASETWLSGISFTEDETHISLDFYYQRIRDYALQVWKDTETLRGLLDRLLSSILSFLASVWYVVTWATGYRSGELKTPILDISWSPERVLLLYLVVCHVWSVFLRRIFATIWAVLTYPFVAIAAAVRGRGGGVVGRGVRTLSSASTGAESSVMGSEGSTSHFLAGGETTDEPRSRASSGSSSIQAPSSRPGSATSSPLQGATTGPLFLPTTLPTSNRANHTPPYLSPATPITQQHHNHLLHPSGGQQQGEQHAYAPPGHGHHLSTTASSTPSSNNPAAGTRSRVSSASAHTARSYMSVPRRVSDVSMATLPSPTEPGHFQGSITRQHHGISFDSADSGDPPIGLPPRTDSVASSIATPQFGGRPLRFRPAGGQGAEGEQGPPVLEETDFCLSSPTPTAVLVVADGKHMHIKNGDHAPESSVRNSDLKLNYAAQNLYREQESTKTSTAAQVKSQLPSKVRDPSTGHGNTDVPPSSKEVVNTDPLVMLLKNGGSSGANGLHYASNGVAASDNPNNRNSHNIDSSLQSRSASNAGARSSSPSAWSSSPATSSNGTAPRQRLGELPTSSNRLHQQINLPRLHQQINGIPALACDKVVKEIDLVSSKNPVAAKSSSSTSSPDFVLTTEDVQGNVEVDPNRSLDVGLFHKSGMHDLHLQRSDSTTPSSTPTQSKLPLGQPPSSGGTSRNTSPRGEFLFDLHIGKTSGSKDMRSLSLSGGSESASTMTISGTNAVQLAKEFAEAKKARDYNRHTRPSAAPKSPSSTSSVLADGHGLISSRNDNSTGGTAGHRDSAGSSTTRCKVNALVVGDSSSTTSTTSDNRNDATAGPRAPVNVTSRTAPVRRGGGGSQSSASSGSASANMSSQNGQQVDRRGRGLTAEEGGPKNPPSVKRRGGRKHHAGKRPPEKPPD